MTGSGCCSGRRAIMTRNMGTSWWLVTVIPQHKNRPIGHNSRKIHIPESVGRLININLLLQVAGCGNASYGDILVVNAPDLAEKVIIKRVVGLAGDTIEIDFDTGEVRRNGELLDEPYINEPRTHYQGEEQQHSHHCHDPRFQPLVKLEQRIFLLFHLRTPSVDTAHPGKRRQAEKGPPDDLPGTCSTSHMSMSRPSLVMMWSSR